MRSLSEVDLLEREVPPSHTSAVEVKNVWNFILLPPTFSNVCYVATHANYYCFYFPLLLLWGT